MKIIFILLMLPVFALGQASTPKCSSVSVITIGELSPSDIAYYNSYTTSTYPSATLIGNASTTYNCHDYAWNKSDGGGTYWMNTPNDDIYWTDGSYVEVTDHALPYATKVSYASDDHSAITTSNSNVVISKWGSLSLMQHAPTYSPYNSSNLKYYSIPVSGNKFICSGSGNFSTFTSSGGSYTWTPGSNITSAVQTGSSNSYTATSPYLNYASTIQVQLYATCSGTTVTGTKDVYLGSGPMISALYYNGGTSYPDPVCQNTPGSFQVLVHPSLPAGGTASFAWSVSNCTLVWGSGTTASVNFNGPVGSMAMVRVEATGVCGVGENATLYTPVADCGNPPIDWRIYPNPVKSITTVALPATPGKGAILQVYDKNMIKRKEIRVTSASVSLNLADMPSGVIYLIMKDGQKQYKKIVLKE